MAREDLPNVIAVFSPALVETRAIVSSWLHRLLGPQPDEYSVVRLDAAAADPDDLQPHLGGMSLLADQRVLIIERTDEWSASQQRRLLQMLRALPPGVSVILTVSGEQAARRQPLVADLMDFLERYGAVERVAKLRRFDAENWVRDRARAIGADISPPAIAALLDRVGLDQDRLASELQKLATFAGEGNTITPEMVLRLVPRTAEASVFALIDAISAGETARALSLLREALPSSGLEHAVAQLLYLLARHFRLLWQARVLLQSGHRLDRLDEVPEEWVGKLPADPNVVAVVRGRDWMARKLETQARALSEAAIVRALREIYMADLTLKGILERRLPAQVVIEILVSRLCTAASQATKT